MSEKQNKCVNPHIGTIEEIALSLSGKCQELSNRGKIAMLPSYNAKTGKVLSPIPARDPGDSRCNDTTIEPAGTCRHRIRATLTGCKVS